MTPRVDIATERRILYRMYTTQVSTRFWSKVNKQGPKQSHMRSRCWVWTAAVSRNGYGAFQMGVGKTMSAHRVAWELAVGKIPNRNDYHGTCVLHRCDNRECVRPSHLRLGSTHDNTLDAKRKGRVAHGSRHGMSKLTESAVKIMRQEYIAGASSVALGRQYKVSKSTVLSIVTRKGWKRNG